MSRVTTEQEHGPVGEPWFTTTHWGIVLAAGQGTTPDAEAALETLCRTYWYPLYAYVRRQGHSPEEAQDLTQEFFARFLEKNHFGQADPERGRFRTFLLTALKNFLTNEWIKTARQKRGSGRAFLSWDLQGAENRYDTDPSDGTTPETIFEKRWAVTLLERVLTLLREECLAGDKGALFEQLKDYVWGEKSGVTYAEVAGALSLSEGAVKVAVHRLRHRFGELLRGEIAHTVARPEEIDDEVHHLIEVMSS
jgi:RNA polymerase sigma factor (sigma-70 family)